MSVIKCPRCEINFIREEDKFCPICLRELKGVASKDDLLEMCIQCGEHPVARGEDLCAFCLNERDLADKLASSLEEESSSSAVSSDNLDMDVLEVPIQNEDIPGDELEKMHIELGLDEIYEKEERDSDEEGEEEL